MRIHKEGYKIISYSALSLLIINLSLFFTKGQSFFFYCLLSLSVILFCILLNFFRNPNRKFINTEDDILIAPADGTVVVIEEVDEMEYFHDRRLQVSIFMSLFNAHVNWIPCKGKITHVSHQNGRFQAAYLPKSSTENERSTIVIQRDNGDEILVRQIAGAMAKRIVTYVKPDMECHLNQQLGFIKFGSRVDLFLPLETKVDVDLHQCVRGNLTILAKLT